VTRFNPKPYPNSPLVQLTELKKAVVIPSIFSALISLRSLS
jgi:hypothetical protein